MCKWHRLRLCSIPLVGQDGWLKTEYYCYWPKDRTHNLIEEFAHILADMFDDDAVE